ncbi:hypothetical protein HaLaN_22358, partial [Haematococcus lacustris]
MSQCPPRAKIFFGSRAAVRWSAMDGTIPSYNGVHMAPAEVMVKAAASTFVRDWFRNGVAGPREEK